MFYFSSCFQGLLLVEFSGLPVGKEGPFVHLASIIANQLIKHVPVFRKILLNEARRLEMLAAAWYVVISVGLSVCLSTTTTTKKSNQEKKENNWKQTILWRIRDKGGPRTKWLMIFANII